MKTHKSLFSTVTMILLISTLLSSLCGCNSLLNRVSGGGEGWEEITNSRHVSYSTPYVRNDELNNGDNYCDSFYIDIHGISADTGDEEGHYIYKNACIILNITVDGKDYTHKIRFLEDGSVSSYSAYINLKSDTTISKVNAGYVRVAGVEGYKKQVPHTYEICGDIYPGDCAKGPSQDYKCKDCNGYKTEVLGEPLGHDIGEDGICSICNRDFNPQIPNDEDSGISYISATYNPYLNLDISPDGIGTRTGTLVVDVHTDVSLISGRGAQSTKEQIITINGVPQWDGNKLIVSYTIMGYGEADILVDLFSNELNDEFRAEIHVSVYDD